MPPKRVPELLAPAGNWECARAAIANGADAVYFGLPRFNARLRADNFTEEELPELMSFLHRHGARGFAAFNTLIFPSELEDAERQLRLLSRAGVDAIIVQDLGLAWLAREIAPALERHASTQMTITSPEGLAFVDGLLGLDRAVLARELSLREIARFRESAVPLEVFVHGALCVAYSGQCLTSEALGQRSANRGECAQACRMTYEMIVDGERVDLGDKRYLLSPQDLAAHGEIAELIRLGVASLKIEGRLKSPEYVAAVTRVYRKAIDAALAGQPAEEVVSQGDRHELEMTFSRGFHSGWLRGVNHPALVKARFGKKRGAFVGAILRAGADWLEVEAGLPLKPGDGVVIDRGGDTNHERGGRVYAVDGRRLTFRRGSLPVGSAEPGDRLWKTDDPALNKRLRQTWRRLPSPAGQPVRLRAESTAEGFLRLTEVTIGLAVTSAMKLEPAQRHPLTEETLRAQLGRLGGTPYELESLDFRLPDGVILPISELNRLRRDLVSLLESRETTPRPESERGWRDLLPVIAEPASTSPKLTVLCRTTEQLAAALDADTSAIYLDFEDIRRFPEAVELARRRSPRTAIFLATPRVQKPGEEGYFKLIARAKPDGVLVRNLGAIGWFGRRREFTLVGDFSLNVANPLTARLLREQGLERLTISHDLNVAQALDLARNTPPDWLELTLHQHMPLFHMEHCVFCAFLSQGTDHTNCGRPCEKHAVSLRDRVGQEHPLAADVGCRNTLFHGRAQSGAAYFPRLRDAGLRTFRVELLREDRAQAAETIRLYRGLLDGKIAGHEVTERLRVTQGIGVTEGTLARA